MLNNVKIGTRLIVSYLAMALIVCITGLIGLHYVSSVGDDGENVGEALAPLADASMEIKLAAAEAHLKFEEIMSGDEGEDVNGVYKRLDEATWYCRAILHGGKNQEGTYQPVQNPQVRKLVETLEGSIANFKRLAQKRYSMKGQDVGVGSAADIEFDRTYDELVSVADQAEEIVHADMAHGVGELRSYSQRAQFSMAAAMIVALATALLAGIMMARAITKPIVRLAELSERMARGDLTSDKITFQEEGQNEVAVLQRSFQRMADRLRGMVGQLQTGIMSLSTSTAEIATTAKETAAASAQQSVTVTEVSTTMDEIQTTSQTAAKNAQEVVTSAERVAASGIQGLQAVDQATVIVAAIEERVREIADKILQLSEQNKQIGEIVESVNDLSEQSNLLAVNASIEAAKAGEQGRGFAVVASEVRTLAEQSKRATQQIRSILGDIQKATQTAVMSTEEGTKRAKDGIDAIKSVRDTITDLAGTLEDSADRMRQISGTATQQAAGIQQISQAVGALARAGKENAAGAGNLERASADIRALSEQLRSTTAEYRL